MTEESADDATGPERIRSIAVHREDVANALEATLRSDREVVLRATPPFSGRMRARLHRPTGDDGSEAINLDPSALVADLPSYPDPDETADRLRAAGEYTTERHHDRHAAAVEEWREAAREAVVDAVALPATDGPHRVEVNRLG